MGIDAKPPVRRGPGAGVIVLAVVGAALCVPLLIVGAVMLSYIFARSTSTPAHVAVSSPTYSSYAAPYPVSVSPEFEARLSAANRIQVNGERDEALAILAADFAQTTEEANQAIRAIQDNDQRDAASWNTARRFSELNRPQDSIAMIENMLDQSTRDAAFRAVATGSWPERPGAAVNATTAVDDSYTTEATAAEGAAH